MRLLNTRTLALADYVKDTPRYAILSHTRGDDEVSFRDLTSDTGRRKAGWSKIINACRYASTNRWEYTWIDTCCIDQNNSTEVGEAINSMFQGYQSAEVCYAYLADVPDDAHGTSFHCSRWFTRGWTLQELLAPTVLEFLNMHWQPIGSRRDLATAIEHATGIRLAHLQNIGPCCVGTRLS